MGYSKEIYTEAVAEMEKRKLLSEQELDQRRMILYAKSPCAEKIERELVKSPWRQARRFWGVRISEHSWSS